MRRLLLWSLLGTVFVALAVSTIPLAILLQEVERDRLLTSLERDAFVLAGRAEEALESSAWVDLAPVRSLATDYREAGGPRVVIVNSTGIALVTNDPQENRVGVSYLSRPEFETALAGTVSTGERFSDTLGINLVYVAVPVFSGPEVIGAVRLTFDAAVIDREVRQQLGGIALVALTTLAMGAVLAIVLSRTLSGGLRELGTSSAAIAEGDFSARVDDRTGPPETRAVARAFNLMADRVGRVVQQQKQFASDASHQLRTPITALMLRADALRDAVGSQPAALIQLDAIETELGRLNRLIDGLLALGRAGAGTQQVEVVAASSICEDRIRAWESLAEEADKHLTSRIAPDVRLNCVPTALEHILDVYIDNALSHTPVGGTIEVALTAEGGRAILSVSDQGPGISEEEALRAFDRFWRGSADYQGTGLGLAIVKQLAEASGAEVSLSSRTGGGAVARADFSIS